MQPAFTAMRQVLILLPWSLVQLLLIFFWLYTKVVFGVFLSSPPVGRRCDHPVDENLGLRYMWWSVVFPLVSYECRIQNVLVPGLVFRPNKGISPFFRSPWWIRCSYTLGWVPRESFLQYSWSRISGVCQPLFSRFSINCNGERCLSIAGRRMFYKMHFSMWNRTRIYQAYENQFSV